MGITVTGRKAWREGRDIPIRIAALAVVTCGIAAACSSTSAVGNSAPDAGDAAVDTGPAKDTGTDRNFVIDGGVCLTALGAMPGFEACGPTFDDPSWRKRVCPTFPIDASFVSVSEQVCGGYLLRNLDLGTHRWACYYQPGSGALVASYFVDDTTDLCDNTSFAIQEGDIPAKGTCTAQVPVDHPCGIYVDGGTDAGDGG